MLTKISPQNHLIKSSQRIVMMRANNDKQKPDSGRNNINRSEKSILLDDEHALVISFDLCI